MLTHPCDLSLHERRPSKLSMLCRARPRLAVRFFACAIAVSLGSGCSSPPDVATWQAKWARPRAESERGVLAREIARVEELRNQLNLDESRRLALSLVAETPENEKVLYLASRAESDAVFLFPSEEKDRRGAAALSSLAYAERATSEGDPDADAQAQLAWALGTSTHLQPMFDRSEHARRTLEVIERALELDPDNTTALATLAVLRLRLATLPWIARLMASGAPEGSIEESIEVARRCVALRPSVEHRLILARALVAGEDREEAIATLESAVAAEPAYPRDRELHAEAVSLLESLRED